MTITIRKERDPMVLDGRNITVPPPVTHPLTREELLTMEKTVTIVLQTDSQKTGQTNTDLIIMTGIHALPSPKSLIGTMLIIPTEMEMRRKSIIRTREGQGETRILFPNNP